MRGRPAILMCNPYYSAYIGGALAADAEPVFLNATEATGHLPDLDALAADKALLERTVALYLCSPANPQGAVASPAYIARALQLARTYDFMLFFDECYSELYTEAPPTGALQVAAATPERFANLVVFNSLSKRSNLPGLRSGFCAGDATLHRYLRGDPQHGGAAGAGADAARLCRCLGGRGARRGQSRSLPAQIRSLRPRSRWPATVTAGRPAASSSGSM